MIGTIHRQLSEQRQEGKKSFAVLIDPDKVNNSNTLSLAEKAAEAGVDYLFIGGSLMVSDYLEECIQVLKANCRIPVILFPGSCSQVSKGADAILYLSLISGRNPDLLIGRHVASAAVVKRSGLEILSTGYMVIDGGVPTSVSYMSGSSPLPADKNDIAVCTAMAGEMLGMKLIFMDAGSGALQPVSEAMITKVSAAVSVPLIIGGGIRDPEKAYRNCRAGADVIVVGNAIEKDPGLMHEIADAVHCCAPAPVPGSYRGDKLPLARRGDIFY